MDNKEERSKPKPAVMHPRLEDEDQVNSWDDDIMIISNIESQDEGNLLRTMGNEHEWDNKKPAASLEDKVLFADNEFFDKSIGETEETNVSVIEKRREKADEEGTSDAVEEEAGLVTDGENEWNRKPAARANVSLIARRGEKDDEEGTSNAVEEAGLVMDDEDELDKKPAARCKSVGQIPANDIVDHSIEESAFEEIEESGDAMDRRQHEGSNVSISVARRGQQDDEEETIDAAAAEDGLEWAQEEALDIQDASGCRDEQATRTFYSKLRELKRYHSKHGHCDVPQNYEENPKLGQWVNKQRTKRKSGKLSERRIRALDSLGFNWGASYKEEAWESKFQGLLAYKRENGNCCVPTRGGQNPSLGRWVSTQRSKYKKGDLNEDKIKRLHEIGFIWDMNNIG